MNGGLSFPFLGSGIPRMVDYRCPACGATDTDELVPQCPACGTVMEPVKEGK